MRIDSLSKFWEIFYGHDKMSNTILYNIIFDKQNQENLFKLHNLVYWDFYIRKKRNIRVLPSTF